MQLLTIKTEDTYIEQILTLVKKIPNAEIKVTNIDMTKDLPKKSAFGILKTPIKDPVAWQQNLRNENDSTLYQ